MSYPKGIQRIIPFVLLALTTFIFSCNSGKKEVKEVTLQDIKVEDSKNEPPPPPPPPPPQPEAIKEDAVQKCFQNEGLKYSVSVSIFMGKTKLMGQVVSTEMGSEKTVTGKFSGTIEGDKLKVKFDGTPPVIGDASEWTDKPWTLKKSGGKEKLVIVFNAKNYETNKWEDQEFEFMECKKTASN